MEQPTFCSEIDSRAGWEVSTCSQMQCAAVIDATYCLAFIILVECGAPVVEWVRAVNQ